VLNLVASGVLSGDPKRVKGDGGRIHVTAHARIVIEYGLASVPVRIIAADLAVARTLLALHEGSAIAVAGSARLLTRIKHGRAEFAGFHVTAGSISSPRLELDKGRRRHHAEARPP
jgi:hypothetical protein